MKKAISAVLLAMAVCMATLFVACGEEKKYVSGEEVGTYYNDDAGKENLIVLKEEGMVEWKVGAIDAAGTYSMENNVLTIKLPEQEAITAKYADKTVTVTVDGKETVFVERVEYTVTFETNEGSKVEALKVLNGKKVAKPADPTKENYKFLGWFTSENAETEFNFETTVINKDVKIYAKWEKIPEYTVTFETNEGSKVDALKVLDGKKVAKPADPTKENYKFLGWFTSESLETEFDFETTIINKDIKIYAKWEYIPVANVLTCDTEGITVEGATVNVKEFETFTIAVPVLKEENAAAIFVGWFTSKDGKGDQLTDETGASIEKWDGRGDMTVYAYFAMPFNYELKEDGTYEVSGTEVTAAIAELEIPAYYKGVAVTSVGVFEKHVNTTKVTVPATVKTISPLAFSEMPLVASYATAAVEGVEASYVAEDGILYSADKSTLVKYPIANGATELVVEPYVIKIAPYAASDIIKKEGNYTPNEYFGTLTKLVFPDNLIEVGEYAFFARQNVTSIEFGQNAVEGVQLTIGEKAFAYTKVCNGLKLPKNVVEIGVGAFEGDSTFAYGGALEASCAGPLVLPEGLKVIGDKAFANNGWITEVTLPSTLRTLGADAFASCSAFYTPDYDQAGGLKKVIIKDGLEVIGAGAFSGNGSWSGTGLKEVQLPKTLRVLEAKAFTGCTDIAKIELPEGLTAIGDKAFLGCKSITEIRIPSSVTSFGEGVLSNCGGLTLEGVIIPEDSKVLSKDDKALFNRDKTTLIMYMKTNENAEYTIPSTVTKIEESAFKENEYLVKVTFPSGLTTIGASAFYSCPMIEEIVLPEGLTEIPDECFYQCEKLAKITIPSTVKSIGNEAFSKAWNNAIHFEVVWAENSVLEKINKDAFSNCRMVKFDIPNSVKVLGEQAFSGNNFTEIVLPDGLEVMGDYAFFGCSMLKHATLPSGLKKVGMAPFWQTAALENIEIRDCEEFKSVDGNLYSKDGTQFYQYAYGQAKTNKTFTIPETVTTIKAYAMAGSVLEDIRITENVEAVDIMVWHAAKVFSFTVDSQKYIDLFKEGAPTDLSDPSVYYIRDDITISEEANEKYFKRFTETASDREGYKMYMKNGYAVEADGNVYKTDKWGKTLIHYNADGKTESKFVINSEVTSLESYAFYWATNITEIQITENVKSVGFDAVWNSAFIKTCVIDGQGFVKLFDRAKADGVGGIGTPDTYYIKEGVTVSENAQKAYFYQYKQAETSDREGYVKYEKI